MANVNKVILIGNVTRDPAIKYLPNSTAVAEFGMAMNRKFTTANGEQKEEVCFVDVSAFGKSAELLQQYVHKGDPLFVEGRLKLDQWEDKQGGGKRSKLTVILENMQFLGSRREGGEGGGQGPGPTSQGGRPAPQREPMRPGGRPPLNEQDDIPF